MVISAEVEAVVRARVELVLGLQDERSRRLVLGAEARVLGRGGIALVARAAGVDPRTVVAGIADLEPGRSPLCPGRVRRDGGGRRRVEDVDGGLMEGLLALVEPARRGDPESSLCWSSLSTRRLAAALCEAGHVVSHRTVGRLLRQNGFSLQGNAKTIEGSQHADRDGQFGYLDEQIAAHQGAGCPVISVDTKKKELVGDYLNKGAQWRPAGDPAQVNVHDFKGPGGKANPYGVYDIGADSGFVAVGTDHDTAAFAVNTIRAWWNQTGRVRYAGASRLLITADGGGSNGYRTRAWKTELAALAAQTGLTITVCHLPPGTSKWNKIEHRLFSHISMNWRGRPLTSIDTIVNLIGATTTSSGLNVEAVRDDGEYPTGVRIQDRTMKALKNQGLWQPHDWHAEWNYTLNPTPAYTLAA